MKLYERINFILLGTLWSLAIVLLLDFWLNTAYNFNMFSNAHWQYVANLQASDGHISSGFYIAFIFAITGCICGFYVLFRPRFRKLILKHPDTIQQLQPAKSSIVPQQNKDSIVQQPEQEIKPAPVLTEPVTTLEVPKHETPQPEPQETITTATTPIMQRPPRLHIQANEREMHQKRALQTQNTVKTNTETPTALYVPEMKEIFEKAGYRVLTPKTISGVPLSLIALGTNETLWLGACNTTHEKMADIVLAFKSLFKETLDDIEIDINTFILQPSDNDSVEAIMNFDSLDALAEEISATPNEPESKADIDSGNMDAFAGYIETVLSYLGNK